MTYHNININYLSDKEKKRLKEAGMTKTKVFGKIRLLRDNEPKNPKGTPEGYISVAFE